MKKVSLLMLALAMTLVGCQSKTATGAVGGGAIGAGTGAIIGGGQGALIGGAVGIIGGGLIGAALDEQDRQVMEKTSPRTVHRMDRHEPLTINDVIKLSQGGVSDDTIIRYIDSSRTSYNLTQIQIDKMRDEGVGPRVINYMIQTGR